GTLAALNAYLASAAAPVFTPALNANGPVTLTMLTSDGGNTGTGGALTDTDTATITVVPVNDAPVLDLDASGAGTGFSATYTENGAGVPVADTDVLIQDVDNTTLASATLIITNGQAGDVLTAAGVPAGISASYDATRFTLTLSGPATLASYQSALAAVRFASTSDNPATAPRLIAVSVSDGTLSSNVAVASVNVVAVNDAPVNTLPATFAASEDSPLTLTGLSVADVDAGTGAVSVTLGVSSGSLSAAAAGGVTVTGSGTASLILGGSVAAINAYLASASAPVFTAVADANGPVTLTMLTNDGGNTGTGTPLTDTDASTIVIAPVVDIAADTATTSEDVPVTLAVLANDSFENPARAITAINGSP
ncbi:hypothetical protein, partial [Methylobacterium sp. B4]|uniref:hypothetical protein n=1 Tax=Methylobacterium sp. B4 TaxID=1938755 RepID=UPI001AEC7EBA